MRRTYRSKKDTGGGVDHRDMVLSVDSKSSIFDAYYIQNIKQVKREMSCVSSSNPYTTASFKVRKRKYVKRLKEPEPVRESLSESAYLTPDKSIRVNKIPDLFDQLLNSSTNACSPKTTASHSNVHNSVQSRMSKKTYCRKKLMKTKKVNHSSSDESDKENSLSDESYSHNTSNIKTHKLLIEKEKILSPLQIDDSIIKMDEIYPALNKLRKQSTESSTGGTDRFSNIVFNITQSPILQGSPQCSTPFHEKYRGKSIYNFSPIRTNLMDESVKFVDENMSNNNLICNPQNDKNNKLENSSIENVSNTKSNLTSTKQINSNNTRDNMLQEHKNSIKQNNSENTGDIIMLQEIKNSTKQNNSENTIHNVLQEIKNIEENHTSSLKFSSVNKSEQLFSSASTSLSTTELEPFLGFPISSSLHNCESDLLKLENKCEDVANSTVADGISDNEDESEQTINENSSTESSIQSQNETNIRTDDLKNKTSSSGSELEDSESFYDTCDSENSSDTSEVIKPKVLTVAVERMNDSVFQKYYKRMVDSSANNENTDNVRNSICNENKDLISNINESDYESVQDEVQDDTSSDSSNDYIYDNNDRVSSENLEIDVQVISSSENDNSDSNDIEEEDKCLSFVTTRRRNDVTNDSFLLFDLDNSCNSASSASLDKTVLSYNRERLENTELLDNTLVNESSAEENNKNNITETNENIETAVQSPIKDSEYQKSIVLKHMDDEMCNINTRKSSTLFRESTYRLSQTNTDESSSLVGLRPAIVLKPGKKWERSLSIYRRMTTMGDAFNHSILDDESMKMKGRKYRQSVISTMEMQEYQGSVHNESVFSRRSTFVSKPRRSTIKIFKDPNASHTSLSSSVLYDDLEGNRL